MILVYPDFDLEFDFEKSENYLLILENSKLFYKTSKMLYEQTKGIDGDFVLSQDLNILNISKTVEFIYDYYNIEINTKKVLTEINNQAIKILRENDFIKQFSLLNENVNQINQIIQQDIGFDIEYKYEFTFEDFVKFSDYKIVEDGSVLELIETYLDFLKRINKSKIVIFVNIFNYFSKEVIDLLIKDLNYKEFYILFLESKEKYKINATRYIIDEDLCLI